MLRFVVLSALVACACAGSYGGSSGLSGGYGGGSYGGGAGLSSGGGYGGGYSSGGSGGGYVTGAVQSRRSVSYYDVPSTFSNAAPLTIDLPSSNQPLNFLFRSQSSPINVQTAHQGSAGSYEATSSQDEPHVRVHTVTRPIVQQLNEIIQPFRKIRQEVQPVQEEIQQVVARGQAQQAYGGGYSSGGYGSGLSGGYGGGLSSGAGQQSTGSYY